MYKPEYKTGDRVVIKPWALMEEQYGLNIPGNISIKVTFTLEMEECLKNTDRVIKLGEKLQDTLFVGTGHLEHFNISSEMILGYAFEYGDEIEVSDTGKEWYLKVFSSYNPMEQNFPVRAGKRIDSTCTAGWKYARPVQEKIIVRFFNGRGEDITESISEETKRKLLIDN